jgi:hypothetical protein
MRIVTLEPSRPCRGLRTAPARRRGTRPVPRPRSTPRVGTLLPAGL